MLVALLSAVLLGGAQGASCAMHGLGAAQADMTADLMAGGGMAAHGGMAGHDAMTGMSHEGSPTNGGAHQGCCSCIGARTMVAPLATAPTAATLLVALVAPEPGRPIETEPRRPPSAEPDRLLPFANGPPSTALA